MIDIAQFAGFVGAALGGGGVSFVVGKWLDNNHASTQSEIVRLREDFTQCEKAHKACEERFDELADRVRAVEASTPSYLARWVKDQSKRVIWLNDRAYLMLFAPLGWTRAEVLDKNFEELLGDGSGQVIKLIHELDQLALKSPGEVQSLVLQLHPDLPNMVILKVAYAGDDGLLRYEGSAYIPTGLSHSMGIIRQTRAREDAARHLFQEQEDDGSQGHL